MVRWASPRRGQAGGAPIGAGVDGAFVMTFVSPIAPHDDAPLYDLDMSSFSLVKSYAGGRHSTTYPDMPWEPKKSFRAVADYYGRHGADV